MTTISAAGSTLTQQLYQKLFDRLNTDGDDALRLNEISGLDAGNGKVSKAFEAMDADADGRVTRAEMTPAESFGADTLNALIQAQSGPESLSDQEYLADWFAKTDTDGDGLVSNSERQASADLRRAAAYDAGYTDNRVLLARFGTDAEQALSIDDFSVGRALTLKASQISDAPPAELALARDETAPDVAAEPLSRDQIIADLAERDSGPEGSIRFLSRQIDGLRAAESARIAADPVSDALAVRLFQQALSNWGPAEASRETVA
ncbi:hypothetical protein GVN18_28905 [Pseudomonas sp. ODNR1LW]|nr:hypothetical protein [Pseudomonas sp. ODNR1LW]